MRSSRGGWMRHTETKRLNAVPFSKRPQHLEIIYRAVTLCYRWAWQPGGWNKSPNTNKARITHTKWKRGNYLSKHKHNHSNHSILQEFSKTNTVTRFWLLWLFTPTLWILNDIMTMRLKCRLTTSIWVYFHPYQVNRSEIKALFVHSAPILVDCWSSL